MTINFIHRFIGPGVFYQIYATQCGILSLGNLYSIGTMRESCDHLLTSVTSGRIFESPPTASRELIGRILVYIHRLLVIEQIHFQDDECLETLLRRIHVPNPTTIAGLSTIFSLMMVAEFSTVIHPDTYYNGISMEDRVHLIQVRKRTRHLRAYLNRWLIVNDNQSVNNVFFGYLHSVKDRLKLSARPLESHKLADFPQRLKNALES